LQAPSVKAHGHASAAAAAAAAAFFLHGHSAIAEAVAKAQTNKATINFFIIESLLLYFVIKRF
jgi:hypothetical protein